MKVGLSSPGRCWESPGSCGSSTQSWAFRYHGALPNNLENAIFGHSLKTYGWVYLVVAAILLVCSFGVVAGSQFSRWIGMFAGAVMAISVVWWMAYYPVWSLVYIFVGVLVIYALAAHGGKETGCPVAPRDRVGRPRCLEDQDGRERAQHGICSYADQTRRRRL